MIGKIEQWEEYLHDILVTEFKFTEGQADMLVEEWGHHGQPNPEITLWDDLWGHAYEWAEALHEDVAHGAISA